MFNKEPPSADLKKLIEQWVSNHLGVKGTIALAMLLALGAIWWNWEKIRKLPGVVGFLDRRTRRPKPLAPLPKATAGRFTIAVAHLEGDQNGEQERLLVTALEEFGLVQVLLFDRIIAAQGRSVEETVKAGHEQARTLLAESNADVLIWGTVLRSGQTTIPKLRWTTSRDLPLETRSRRYQLTPELELPEVFKSDLTYLLDLLVLTSGDYLQPAEAYTRTPLPEFIIRIERLLAAESPKWPRETRVSLTFAFADLCLVYGIQDWKNDEWLKKAQSAYKVGLPKPGDEWLPRSHAPALFNYAQTYSIRGVCLPDSEQLKQAIPLYRAVVDLCSWGRDNWHYTYAYLQLGHALRLLGENESGTAKLQEAIDAYTSAADKVNVRTQLDWHRSILFGRAEALRLIGERVQGIQRLQEAIPPYEELLKLYDASTEDLSKQVQEKLQRTRTLIRERSST